MNIFDFARNVREIFTGKRATKSGTAYLSDPAAWLEQFFTGTPVWSGAKVNESTALEYISFWACMKVIRETIASLPVILYKRVENGKERDIDNPVYELLHIKPNPEQAAYDFKEMLAGHYMLYGNMYAEKVFDSNGEIAQLWPLLPWKMTVKRKGGERLYYYTLPNDRIKVFFPFEVLHVSNYSLTGLAGERPVEYAKQAIGSGLSADEYSARFFKNDARPGGIIEMPGNLGTKADVIKRFKASWEKNYGSMTNKHRVAILEDGAKFHEVTIDPEKSQLQEMKKLQRNLMASFHRLPPHLIGDLEHATYTNIESQSLEFVKYTMLPHFVRWEQNFTIQLLKPLEIKNKFFEVLVDGLVRGDIKTRYDSYRIGREIGVLSVNDVRRMENLNTIEGGDDHHKPLNWSKLNEDKPILEENKLDIRKIEHTENRALRSASTRQRIANSYRRIFEDVLNQILGVEIKQIKKNYKRWLVERTKKDFDNWYKEFYNKHYDYVVKRMTPVYMSIEEAVRSELKEELEKDFEEDPLFVDNYVNNYSKDYIRGRKRYLGFVVAKIVNDQLDVDEEFNKLFHKWQGNITNDSLNETVNSSNAISKNYYKQNGVQFLRWVNTGSKTCPYCASLDGVIIGIDDTFVQAGVQVEGGDKPMSIKRDILHPGLHSGCDCQVIAG